MFNAPATNKESVWFMYDSWMSHTWITINYVSLQGLILYYLVFINSVNSCVNYHKSHAIEAMDFDFQPSETGMPLYKMNWHIYLLMPWYSWDRNVPGWGLLSRIQRWNTEHVAGYCCFSHRCKSSRFWSSQCKCTTDLKQQCEYDHHYVLNN